MGFFTPIFANFTNFSFNPSLFRITVLPYPTSNRTWTAITTAPQPRPSIASQTTSASWYSKKRRTATITIRTPTKWPLSAWRRRSSKPSSSPNWRSWMATLALPISPIKSTARQSSEASSLRWWWSARVAWENPLSSTPCSWQIFTIPSSIQALRPEPRKLWLWRPQKLCCGRMAWIWLWRLWTLRDSAMLWIIAIGEFP